MFTSQINKYTVKYAMDVPMSVPTLISKLTWLGKETPADVYTATLTGLIPNKTYYISVMGETIDGSGITASPIRVHLPDKGQ